MKRKIKFKNTVRLFEILANLASIPRVGPILWNGVPPSETETVADHKLKVAYLMMVLGDLALKEGKKIDMECLLRKAIIHDWDEVILGDVPSDSPSYQSYFEQNLGGQYERARKKVIREIAAFVKNEIERDYAQLTKDQNHPVETLIEDMASLIANLFELLALRKRGYRDRYIELFWVRILQQMKEKGKEFSFTKDLIETLNERFDKFTELNPFLAKGKYLDRKEYRKKS